MKYIDSNDAESKRRFFGGVGEIMKSVFVPGYHTASLAESFS